MPRQRGRQTLTIAFDPPMFLRASDCTLVVVVVVVNSVRSKARWYACCQCDRHQDLIVGRSSRKLGRVNSGCCWHHHHYHHHHHHHHRRRRRCRRRRRRCHHLFFKCHTFTSVILTSAVSLSSNTSSSLGGY